MIGVPLRLSHKHECSTWLDSLLVNREIAQDYSVHCVQNNLNLLRLLDQPLPKEPLDCEVHFTKEELGLGRGLGSKATASGKKAASHPGRIWQNQKFNPEALASGELYRADSAAAGSVPRSSGGAVWRPGGEGGQRANSRPCTIPGSSRQGVGN